MLHEGLIKYKYDKILIVKHKKTKMNNYIIKKA